MVLLAGEGIPMEEDEGEKGEESVAFPLFIIAGGEATLTLP